MIDRPGTNIWAKKSLGQHFLFDEAITDTIVRLAAIDKGATVLEVGPGPGGLTRSLLKSPLGRLILVEKDDRFIDHLEKMLDQSQIPGEVLRRDALSQKLSTLGDGPFHIVSNLPYNVGTRLLLNWCEEAVHLSAMTLMFQKEVALRLLAKPGDSAYGSLSVWAQWHMAVTSLMTLSASAFTPPPKVDSMVVHLTPYTTPPYPADPEKLQRLLGLCFQQRRKMLRRSLKNHPGFEVSWLEQVGIDPEARPETLTLEAFCRLSWLF